MTGADIKSAGGTQAAFLQRSWQRALTCAALVVALLGTLGLDKAKADEVMIENCL
jgi:hypothetical protein